MRQEKGFETIERDVDVASVTVPPGATVLLECLCNLAANEIFDEEGHIDKAAPKRILAGISLLEERCENLIVVTNDVGSESCEGFDASTRLYVEELGRMNALLAARFDVVYELVCGIPLVLKGSPIEAEEGVLA
jgi:adenosylcobinamide kinase/adenosylcobinamide-phosphate guanylyltransferase